MHTWRTLYPWCCLLVLNELFVLDVAVASMKDVSALSKVLIPWPYKQVFLKYSSNIYLAKKEKWFSTIQII